MRSKELWELQFSMWRPRFGLSLQSLWESDVLDLERERPFRSVFLLSTFSIPFWLSYHRIFLCLPHMAMTFIEQCVRLDWTNPVPFAWWLLFSLYGWLGFYIIAVFKLVIEFLKMPWHFFFAHHVSYFFIWDCLLVFYFPSLQRGRVAFLDLLEERDVILWQKLLDR